jgi:hypothetical protein
MSLGYEDIDLLRQAGVIDEAQWERLRELLAERIHEQNIKQFPGFEDQHPEPLPVRSLTVD